MIVAFQRFSIVILFFASCANGVTLFSAVCYLHLVLISLLFRDIWYSLFSFSCLLGLLNSLGQYWCAYFLLSFAYVEMIYSQVIVIALYVWQVSWLEWIEKEHGLILGQVGLVHSPNQLGMDDCFLLCSS